MVKEISREELKAKMDRGDGFVLVEALSRRHYESSHLPGAINLPYEFVDEAEKVLPDKHAEIVVYVPGMRRGRMRLRRELDPRRLLDHLWWLWGRPRGYFTSPKA